MEFLLHKKFGRAIFFSYREFSLIRSSLIGSFDCTSTGHNCRHLQLEKMRLAFSTYIGRLLGSGHLIC